MAKPISILVLCTGNSCRSRMAEGFLNLSGTNCQAQSAGTHPKELNPDAVAVMAEVGIGITGGRSRHVDEFAGRPFDCVITVCDEAEKACPSFPGAGRQLHWSFEDPAEATGPDQLEVFRRVRDEIAARVESFAEEMKKA